MRREHRPHRRTSSEIGHFIRAFFTRFSARRHTGERKVTLHFQFHYLSSVAFNIAHCVDEHCPILWQPLITRAVGPVGHIHRRLEAAADSSPSGADDIAGAGRGAARPPP